MGCKKYGLSFCKIFIHSSGVEEVKFIRKSPKIDLGQREIWSVKMVLLHIQIPRFRENSTMWAVGTKKSLLRT